jgi:hypothetical protein
MLDPDVTETDIVNTKWPMASTAESRCRLGMLRVNKLRHSYLNVMKLENYGPQGNI